MVPSGKRSANQASVSARHPNSKFATLISRCRFGTLSGFILLVAAFVTISAGSAFAQQQNASALTPPSRLVAPIDEKVLATLKGNVRQDVSRAEDLGPVEDAMPLHMFLLLQRSPAQQADLENLIALQQQPGAPEYHQWLTPAEFGARFGASPQDIATLSAWLESHGFQIRSVLNNASMISFAGTAGQVRDAFHTQLHYFNLRDGKYPALIHDPQIPAALAPVVVGIEGLNKIPAVMNHTKPRQSSWDQGTHSWHIINPTGEDVASPAYDAGAPFYLVSPQDLYTIYKINPVFTGGNLAASATVAVIEQSDIEYGTVNSTTHVATGGDVVTFRNLFGVPGTLNMHVYHGFGSVACNDPGIDPDKISEDVEASLDAEWANATAPSANLIFMSCDQSPDNGIFSSLAALVDNNLSDVMSLSYGSSELNFTSSDYTFTDGFWSQAATQGQSILVSSGDSGSDVKDQNTAGTATSGINVSAFGSPLVTVTGGTDFQDYYDSLEGGAAESTYWSSTNSAHYGDALSYVPETTWNSSCASSILTKFEGFTGAGFCATGNYTSGQVVGGSGGISTHYAVPSWQTGTSGYSNSMHSQPDIAGFASSGFWGHALLFCDSNPSDTAQSGCTSTSNFGEAGGTSFVAPYMAGVFGLLRTATGSRQGVLNPALYALARAQYAAAATKTACYANGQTSNTGVTTGLPAAGCIFNIITTSNNDVPCAAGSTSCFVNSGQPYGMLSLTGSSSLTVAYPSTTGFDQATGLGSVNVSNLIANWNTAFTSSTTLSANPTSISSTQSTQLTGTVTGGTPTGYVDTPPAVTGTVTFKAGTTVVGSCALSSGSCSTMVSASSLQSGANSMSAIFGGSGTYPSSTSSIVTVTVTATVSLPTVSTGAASSIASGTATLNGTVNPNGASTSVSFLYGTSSTLAGASSTSPQNIGSGSTDQAVSANISGLTPNTKYYFQVQATNSAGTASGAINSFTTAPAGLQFVSVTPCRVVDTRLATGPFGGPEMSAGSTREFDIPQSACNIPATAVAYSLNVTVVPNASLGYLTIWPAGQSQPLVSTLNSDGRIKANAAIVPAGTNGGVDVYVTDATQLVLDIDGYFAPAGTTSALAFYPVTPCRVADTRNATGSLGGPSMSGGTSRAFPVQSSSCGIPATAQAYSLNMTAVPKTSSLGYLTLWPTGQTQPLVSTLNSPTGEVVANAAIVPAGTSGNVSVYVTDNSDVVIDIDGYFAPPGTGGLSLYTVSPCRVIDTRNGAGAFAGTLTVNVTGSTCAPPATAQAYVFNATVVPSGSLGYLTLWPNGASQPLVSTLNSPDGTITSNMAIVPTTNGSINAYATNPTQLILDISSYFAP